MKITNVLLLSSLVSSFCLFAEDSHELDGSSEVYVGPMWNYVTSDWGNGLNQKGSLWGAFGGYTYKAKDSVFFHGEFSYTAGMLKGSAGNDPTQEYETEIRLGYSFALGQDKCLLIPFFGGGSYILHQSLSGHLDFNSYFWYIPIGLACSYQINSNWIVGFMGLGAPTFGGRWKEHESHKANTKPLWKAEVPVSFVGCLPFKFLITPFLTGWGFHKSGALESQVNTYYGMKLAVEYEF